MCMLAGDSASLEISLCFRVLEGSKKGCAFIQKLLLLVCANHLEYST